MSPQVTAAIIAAGGVVLTVIATVAVQISGRRATSRDTQKTLAEQREQLNTTLTEQRDQLDKTLAEQRTRALNERFTAASGQLGSDKPTVRLAGVHAMAGLADDWPENRQTCVDVLCAYLRMPYEPDPGDEAPGLERLVFRASREVRHTVIRLIGAHLSPRAAVSWQGLDFDFTGVVFDGSSFGPAVFSGVVHFDNAVFSGGRGDFGGAEFSSPLISFMNAVFSGGRVSFMNAVFSGGNVLFVGTEFSGGEVVFRGAELSRSQVIFDGARFSGGTLDFSDAAFIAPGQVVFSDTEFSGGEVYFRGAEFSGGEVIFDGARFTGSEVAFDNARFTGSQVSFCRTEFSGGTVDFSDPGDWSVPPAFPWTDTPPPGVMLPEKDDQSQA